MKCPMCGRSIARNSLFCKYCGYRIPQKPKYIRSQAMKTSMRILLISLVLFAVGMLLAFVIPPIGIVLFGLGAIGLVGGSIAYLIAEMEKRRKDEDTMCYDHVTPLPIEPVVIPASNKFIYPDMLPIKSYFEHAIAIGSSDGFVSVMFNHAVVLQIIDCPEPKKDEKHNIGVFFFPYLYEDSIIYERFADNEYLRYFSNNPINSDEGVDAYFGTDIQKALLVASHILANVYYIPTNAKLQLDCKNV